MPLDVRLAKDKQAVLAEIKAEAAGPISGDARFFTPRTFVMEDFDFNAPKDDLRRRYGADKFSVRTRFLEKDNLNRDKFNVYFYGKAKGGEEFELFVGTISDSST
jgi:hypothetical protein